ncbi:MAG: hypothetical protein K6T86_21290, partial [Pirellulales bacterium]|nr:hypothetical protein [Pirellulales bacterium]
PMTLEAVALAYLDDLDAKLHHFSQLMREDPNVESPWTVYHPLIGRKLFKGTPEGGKSRSTSGIQPRPDGTQTSRGG